MFYNLAKNCSNNLYFADRANHYHIIINQTVEDQFYVGCSQLVILLLQNLLGS